MVQPSPTHRRNYNTFVATTQLADMTLVFPERSLPSGVSHDLREMSEDFSSLLVLVVKIHGPGMFRAQRAIREGIVRVTGSFSTLATTATLLRTCNLHLPPRVDANSHFANTPAQPSNQPHPSAGVASHSVSMMAQASAQRSDAVVNSNDGQGEDHAEDDDVEAVEDVAAAEDAAAADVVEAGEHVAASVYGNLKPPTAKAPTTNKRNTAENCDETAEAEYVKQTEKHLETPSKKKEVRDTNRR